MTAHLDLVLRLRMCGGVSPLPQYVFMAWYFVKHRDRLTLPVGVRFIIVSYTPSNKKLLHDQ